MPLRWLEGDPGLEAEKGAEEEAKVRKVGNRSGSCRMDCGALCFWFDASPLWSLLLLALGERGRGEKGKLAMLLGTSGEVTLVVKHVMSVKKRQP